VLFCAPLVRPFASLFFVAMLFLLDLLLCSFCSTCSAPLARPVAPLFLLDMLFHSFCLTCCFALLIWLVILLFLFNWLHSSCSTCCSSYLTSCAPFVQPTILFLLHDWLHSSYLTCYFTFLVWMVALLLFNLLLFLLYPCDLLFFFPLARPCCSIPFASNWYSPSPTFSF